MALTTLFSGNLTIPAGNTQTPVFKPPQGFSTIDILMDADPFPTGTTTITIFMSFDGGTTFPSSASMTWDAPHTFPPQFAHRVQMSFSIEGANRAKVQTSAPAMFTTATTISAE